MSSEDEAIERMRSSSYAQSIGGLSVEAVDRLLESLQEKGATDLIDLDLKSMIEQAGGEERLVVQFHLLRMICAHNPTTLKTVMEDLEDIREPLLLLLGNAEDRRS